MNLILNVSKATVHKIHIIICFLLSLSIRLFYKKFDQAKARSTIKIIALSFRDQIRKLEL